MKQIVEIYEAILRKEKEGPWILFFSLDRIRGIFFLNQKKINYQILHL